MYPEEVITQFKAGLHKKEKEREKQKEKEKEKEKQKERETSSGHGQPLQFFQIILLLDSKMFNCCLKVCKPY